MSALSLFTSSTLPLAESLTLAHLATTDGHYSRIRLWGSIGFIAASLLLGYLIDLRGINILLWALLVAQAIIFYLSNTIPETQGDSSRKKRFIYLEDYQNTFCGSAFNWLHINGFSTRSALQFLFNLSQRAWLQWRHNRLALGSWRYLVKF